MIHRATGFGDGMFALTPGSGGEASQYDVEGDATFVWWNVANPQFTVQRDSSDVWGNGFDPFESLTIGVDEDPLAADGDEFTSDPFEANEHGDFGTNVDEWTFAAGHVVTVGSKLLVLSGIAVTGVNESTNVVSGVAEPGVTVQVWIHDEGGEGYETTADETTGVWSVLFGDLSPGVQGAAAVRDDDGDQTQVDWSIANPTVRVNAVADYVSSNQDWPVGAAVTVAVFDDPLGDPVCSVTATVEDRSGPGEDGFVGFEVGFDPGTCDIVTGQTVTATTGAVSASVVVTAVQVVGVDLVESQVFGVAGLGSEVDVNGGNNDGGNGWRQVTADGPIPDGYVGSVAGLGGWTADFDDPPLLGLGDGMFPLTPGSGVEASQYDGEGDATFDWWNVANPQFTVQRDSSDVWGNGFDPDTVLTVGVDTDPPDPEWWTGTPEHTRDVTTDGDGNFGVSMVDLVSILPGHVVSVDGKWLLVSAIAVTDVNVTPNVVSGVAEPGVTVQVWIHDEGGEGYETTADETTGVWSVLFGGLSPGVQGAAAVRDDDGDQTQVDWSIANPTVRVNAVADYVSSNQDWPVGAAVTVAVFDDPLGDPVCSATVTVEDRSGPGEDGFVGFEVGFDPGTCDIVTGQTLTATHDSVEHGLISASVVVTAVQVVGVDPVESQVFGVAESGTDVEVNGGNNDGGNGWRQVTADGPIPDGYVGSVAGLGGWTADFDDPPATGFGDGMFALTPGSGGEASQYDVEGDATFDWWNVANPQFTVQRDSSDVWGNGFDPDTVLTVGVDTDPPDPEWWTGTPEHTRDVTTDGDGNFGVSMVDLVSILPGHVVSVDGKWLLVSAIAVTDVNVTPNVVSGVAEPGVTVQVWIHDEGGEGYETTADETTGVWSVLFGGLSPGVQGAAAVRDDDGDQTQVDWSIANPTVRVNPWADYVSSNQDWPVGELVTVAVFDDPPGAGPVCSATVTVEDRSGPGEDGFVGFEVGFDPGTCDVVTGQTVTATTGAVSASVVVTAVQVVGVDPVESQVFGVAESGTDVEVNGGNNDGGNGWRQVTADGPIPDGYVGSVAGLGGWTADFDDPPATGFGDGMFPLTPGSGGEAWQYDGEGDATFDWWNVADPNFGVNPQADHVFGSPDWTGPVTVKIGDDEWTGLPVDPTDGFFLDLSAGPFPHDLIEGDEVVVTGDDGYTKDHIVTGLSTQEPDADADTVDGAAHPGGRVSVWVHDSEVWRQTTAGGDTMWHVDFTAAGLLLAEQGGGEFDLVPGTAGGAAEFDDDDDYTQIDWQVNYPPVANDDIFVTDEDSDLADLDVLDNDEDEDGDGLTVESYDASGTTGEVGLIGPLFEYSPGGHFDYLGEGDTAIDTWTYVAVDGRGGLSAATVEITINGVNDPPTMDDEPGQIVQYSDGIVPIVFTASDVDSDSLAFEVTGLPSSLVTVESCAPDGVNGVVCTLTISGTVTDPAGPYVIDVIATDGGASVSAATAIDVIVEDAAVSLHGGNPTAIPVDSDDDSPMFELMFRIRHVDPDVGFEPTPGDLTLADPTIVLEPVGPGSPVVPNNCDTTVTGDGYDTQLTVTCAFDHVPINTYLVTASSVGGYFAGFANGVLVVYDPSAGEVSGGGTFDWDGDDTEFGFTMEYNKKGNKLKGSFLMIRHTDSGDYVVKSNSLYGMAIGNGSAPWATFSGKATVGFPSGDNYGNYEFVVRVDDGDPDLFWVEVRDKDRIPVLQLSMDRGADGLPVNSAPLAGGDVVVPNGNGKERRGK